MLGRLGVCVVHSATRQTNTASFSIVEFSAEPKTLAYTSYRSYDARVRPVRIRIRIPDQSREHVRSSCACALLNRGHVNFSLNVELKGVNYNCLLLGYTPYVTSSKICRFFASLLWSILEGILL